MKELTKKRKLAFIEYAINWLSSPPKRMKGHVGLCTWYMVWRKKGFCNTTTTNHIITVEFPELMAEIGKAFEKIGGGLYIYYSYSYRYKGRIRLINRVKKQLRSENVYR